MRVRLHARGNFIMTGQSEKKEKCRLHAEGVPIIIIMPPY